MLQDRNNQCYIAPYCLTWKHKTKEKKNLQWKWWKFFGSPEKYEKKVVRHSAVKGHTKKKLLYCVWVPLFQTLLSEEVSVWREGWKDGKKWRATKSLEANDVKAQMYSRIQGNKTKQAERHDGNSAKCHTNKIDQVSKKQHGSWGRK